MLSTKMILALLATYTIILRAHQTRLFVYENETIQATTKIPTPCAGEVSELIDLGSVRSASASIRSEICGRKESGGGGADR